MFRCQRHITLALFHYGWRAHQINLGKVVNSRTGCPWRRICNAIKWRLRVMINHRHLTSSTNYTNNKIIVSISKRCYKTPLESSLCVMKHSLFPSMELDGMPPSWVNLTWDRRDFLMLYQQYASRSSLHYTWCLTKLSMSQMLIISSSPACTKTSWYDWFFRANDADRWVFLRCYHEKVVK